MGSTPPFLPPPRPTLPNVECFDCDPAGNTFMEHRETTRQRLFEIGAGEQLETVAIFRCRKCGRTRREAFEPGVPPAV